MKLVQISAVVALLLLPCATSAAIITIETVPVGDIGNPYDPADGDSTANGVQNFGAVSYAYRIGKYEVTVGQYTAFLNAVAATDTYGLYATAMAERLAIAGIAQNGSSGSYNYSVIGSPNHPIAELSWGDAARFANWIQNGQPTGAQGPGTTETGAYTLNGATSTSDLLAVTRNPGAIWFIPTENEWYKAAYYQPAAKGGDTDGYWTYQMKTNSQPYSVPPPGTAAPDNTRAANYFFNDGVANGYDNGFAVTGSTGGCTGQTAQNCLTDVGAYTSSPSFYGTFDQGGGLNEWNEAIYSNNSRGERGGSWEDAKPQSSWRDERNPAGGYAYVGLRLASIADIPEPTTAALAASAFALLAFRRRRRG